METRKDAGRVLWGLVLVALGLLFLAGNFGYHTWGVWDRWWPLLLIAIGVIMLYRHRADQVLPVSSLTPIEPGAPAEARRFPTGAIILIGVGAAFLLDEWVGGNTFPAFVLIAIGVALVLRQRAAS
jgi:hypothetical protein